MISDYKSMTLLIDCNALWSEHTLTTLVYCSPLNYHVNGDLKTNARAEIFSVTFICPTDLMYLVLNGPSSQYDIVW